MIHASLCTGIGACELAATWMGWENAFSCEIDEFCNKVLSYHYPNTTHYGNIFEQDFREWRGKIDVLTAGFPCQPFSCAGKRNGAEDDRYLWNEVFRVIDEVRPTWFIGENVAGITTMVLPGEEVKVGSYSDICGESYSMYEKRQRYVIDQIRLDLESIGYTIKPIVIPACAVGAPHRRDRVWFLARRDDTSNPNSTGLQTQGSEQQATRIAGSGLQWNVADADSNRFGIRENKQGNITGSQGKTNDCTCGEDGITPDPDGERCHDGSDNRKKRQVRANGKRGVTEDKPEWNERECRVSKNGTIIANSQRVGSDKIHENLQPEQPDGDIVDRIIGKWNASNSSSKGLQREVSRNTIMPPESFKDFPTQSPVCNRDDGISFGLSGISFSRWRQESIKALGNSMVPQVVYEIFLAIEQVEETFTKKTI